MSSKVILLNETITISHEFRNLSGHEFSLQDLPMHDYDESVRLYSMHFCELEDLEDIWNKGNTLIALLNGGLNLYLRNSDRQINVSANCITDPFLMTTLYISRREDFTWTYPFSNEELQRNLNESNFSPSDHFLNRLINLSVEHEDVFELLILNSLERNLTNLYKLYETIEFYFKTALSIKLSNGLQEYGITKSQIRSFIQTANHGNYNIFDLILYDVRHGRNKQPNNFRIMRIYEATTLIQSILSAYLTIKYDV